MTDEEALQLVKKEKTSLSPGPVAEPIARTTFKVVDRQVLSSLEDLLNRSMTRHDGTQCTCLHGRSRFRLMEAYQVKDRHLWLKYQRCVRSIRDKRKQYGITPANIDPSVGGALTKFAQEIDVDLAGNEILLFHGTRTWEDSKDIAREGFDSRIAKSSGLYGKGTYFAAQTCKSAQYATPSGQFKAASSDMMGTMLLARVAIGDPYYTTDRYAESRPPMRPVGGVCHDPVRYDSLIARPGISSGLPNLQSHMEVVTFAPEQAYPEFILRFVED